MEARRAGRIRMEERDIEGACAGMLTVVCLVVMVACCVRGESVRVEWMLLRLGSE